ncbi:TRAP transporter substrate-binding protein [Limobrevibacterium gyesilva]|uniref:TRAP transporter substrate-binding protein n=1 Tax=Limobrevibacterium gyesilva TaxID=2991712 RepID=A0AA41YLB5_9PROT|nr:TRAP transporter substrate-binding protein [Limobrevibacterium gyesilva]MCW3474028.1 TRAP transporter substrate-binding protein [Limobrevibacterium gyesilva]
MTRLTRRSMLAAGAAVPLFAIRTRPAHAAEFSYKYANNLPLSHPMNARAAEAASRVKEKTGGRLEIQIFPNNQLGSDTDTLSQLRSGAVEFFTLSGLILSTLVPTASINGVGFAFKDYGQVWPAMDGPLGAHVRGEVAKRGLYAFARQWDNGYRQITSSTRPIRTPEDLNGFKIRVPPSPLWTSLFKAFGASPTSINFSETYSALQTRIVDGQENPLAIIDTAKLYEVQKYLSVTNHMWDGFWFLANRRAFEALPADIRQTVEAEFNASALAEREDVAKLNATLQGSLKARGMEFIDTDATAFRAALKKAGFYAEWREKFGAEAWGALEAAVGSLA